MKRVYLLLAVLVVLLSIGKYALYPPATTASLPISPQPAAAPMTVGELPTLDHPSSVPSPWLPEKRRSSQDKPDLEDFLSEPLTLLGAVVPTEQVAIRASVSGTVGELPVREGSPVVAGQAVAFIDDGEIRAELERAKVHIASKESLVEQTQALVDLADYNHGLNGRLAQKRLVAKASLVESELHAKAEAAKLAALQADVAVAQRERAVLQQRLAKYRAIAPFSGSVTEVLRYRDQYVGQGDVILWIESHEKQLKLHLPAELIQKCGGALDRLQISMLVQEGQWLDLTLPKLKPSYNPDGSRTVLFKIEADSGLLTAQVVKTKVSLRGEKS